MTYINTKQYLRSYSQYKDILAMVKSIRKDKEATPKKFNNISNNTLDFLYTETMNSLLNLELLEARLETLKNNDAIKVNELLKTKGK
jgi:hypothetical protein